MEHTSPDTDSHAGPSRSLTLLLAAVGAILAASAEWLHLKAGVWALPEGESFPLWIPVLYFPALLLLLSFLRVLERRTNASALPRSGLLPLAGETALLLGLFAAPMLWPLAEATLTFALILYLGLRLIFLRSHGDLMISGDLKLAGGLLLADALLESALLRTGLYSYPGAGLMTFPLWGPLLWAAMGLSLRRLYRALPSG